MSCSIVFVIDPPGLIAEAVPLIFSIREHLPNAHVIAYCPKEKETLVPKIVRNIFDENEIEIRFFDGQNRFSPHYRQGNKLLAVSEYRETDFTIFLDTDVVVWQPFSLEEITIENTVCAAPEGVRSWPVDPNENWPDVYRLYNLEVPTRNVRLAKTGGSSKPYFNGGVVAFPNKVDGLDCSFGQLWLETAQELDHSDVLITSRPWLDQVSLPISIARSGLDWTALSINWNLSLSRPFGGQSEMSKDKKDRANRAIAKVNKVEPYFLHYHKPKFFWGTKFEGYLDRLTTSKTSFGNYRDLVGYLRGGSRAHHGYDEAERRKGTGPAYRAVGRGALAG